MGRMRALLAAIIIVVMSVTVTRADSTIDSMTNQFREANGLAPLHTSSLLTGYAAYRAKQITTDFNHHIDALSAWVSSNFSCWRQDGENIAYSSGNVGSSWAVHAWENSPEHRANMLTGIYTLTGSARYYDAAQDRTYFVQEFVATCGSTTVTKPKATATPRPKVVRHKATPMSKSKAEKSKPKVPFVLPNTSVEF